MSNRFFALNNFTHFLAFVKAKSKQRYKANQVAERRSRGSDGYADDDLYPFDDPNNLLLDYIR